MGEHASERESTKQPDQGHADRSSPGPQEAPVFAPGVASILALQRSAGNQAVLQLVREGRLHGTPAVRERVPAGPEVQGSVVQRDVVQRSPDLPPVGSFHPGTGIVVDRVGRAMTVRGRLQIYGSAATPAMAGQAQGTINRFWNHNFGNGESVSTTAAVTFRQESVEADGSAAQIRVAPMTGPSCANASESYIHLNSAESDILTWTVAHEFGHLLGMGDRYTEGFWSRLSGQLGGSRTATVNPGYEGNMMAEVGGTLGSQNVRDLAEENAPGYFTDDNQVREWVSRHGSADIDRLPAASKIGMIRTLMGGWISDEDVSAIQTICRAVSNPAHAAAIRQAIEPELIHMTSIGQRTEVRVAFSNMAR